LSCLRISLTASLSVISFHLIPVSLEFIRNLILSLTLGTPQSLVSRCNSL
jgi:hypothetical protein